MIFTTNLKEEGFSENEIYLLELYFEIIFLLEELKKISFSVFKKNILIRRGCFYSLNSIITKIDNIPDELKKKISNVNFKYINDILLKLKEVIKDCNLSIIWETFNSIIPVLRDFIRKLINTLVKKRNNSFIKSIIKKIENNEIGNIDGFETNTTTN